MFFFFKKNIYIIKNYGAQASLYYLLNCHINFELGFLCVPSCISFRVKRFIHVRHVFLRMQTYHDAFIFRICATFSFLDGVLVGSTPFERTDNEIKILNESMTTPLSVVARDGIEPPTQAFSGLCSTN